MQTTFLHRTVAVVSALALLCIPYSGIDTANAGTATSVSTALVDGTAISTPSTITFAFTPATALVASGSILINIPVGFTAGTWSSVDVTGTQADATFGAATVSGSNAAGGTITLPITTVGAGTGAVLITIGATTKFTNPATPGQYAFQVSTKNAAGAVIDTGYALASVANTAAVSLRVAEALILTLTNGVILGFNTDPSVNNGLDQSQSTTLLVKTNAQNYSIRADLTSAVSNDGKLCLNGTCGANREITSATSGENTIAFTPVEGVDDAGTIPAHLTQEGAATFGSDGNVANGATVVGLKNNHAWRVSYDLDTNYGIMAGNYTGTITYTATPTF